MKICNKMEQTPNAHSYTIFSGLLAFISVESVGQYVSIGAGLVAIISGIFAIRYYIIKSKNNG